MHLIEERTSSFHVDVFHLFGSYILGDDEAPLDAGARVLPRVATGEADMGENAAATPAKARTRIVRRICHVTRRCYSCCSWCCLIIACKGRGRIMIQEEQDNNPAPDAEHD